MSVSKIVLEILKSKEWVSNTELEDMFPKGTKGHYSWPQRLRGLRDKGFIITRRIKEGTQNLSEWHLAENAPMPATCAETPQNKAITPKIVMDYPNGLNMPQNAKNEHLALETAIAHNNFLQEDKINRAVCGKQQEWLGR